MWLRPHTLSVGRYVSLGPTSRSRKKVVDFLDALKIGRATLVGYDWGSRAACVAAALWPERVRALISVGGYTIQNIALSARNPQSAEQEHQFWYQWYFQTERGREGLEQNRDELCKLLWKLWSPTWRFAENLFVTTAKSFHNPDFVATVIQSYRHRYADAAGDPSLEALEKQLGGQPKIAVPTIALQGEDDRVNPPSSSEKQESQFTGHYERKLLQRVGHCPLRKPPTPLPRRSKKYLLIVRAALRNS